jgi:coenzyme F420-reducing hydrogenase delta subunit
VANVKKLLDEIGIGGERVEMFWMSAGMGERFARTASDFTEKIRSLGPNPAKAGMKSTLAAGWLRKNMMRVN